MVPTAVLICWLVLGVYVAMLLAHAMYKEGYERGLVAGRRPPAESPPNPIHAHRIPICRLPPSGWFCTREGGHTGPCTAWPRLGGVAERLWTTYHPQDDTMFLDAWRHGHITAYEQYMLRMRHQHFYQERLGHE